MTLLHHPSEVTLANFAAGTLDEARRLVVATHVSRCPSCRTAAGTLLHMGGMMLDDAKPIPLKDGAFVSALARLHEPVKNELAVGRDESLPAQLAPYELGPWRWIGGGVQWRSVAVPVVAGVRVFMLRAQGGTRLPRHRHQGIEWTCVLAGAYRHELGRFGSGDFDEADETIEHHPAVEPGEPCICLVALEGNIELQSWLGRLLQPFIRL